MEESNTPATSERPPYPGITKSAENLWRANESLKAIQEERADADDHQRVERLVIEQRAKARMADYNVDELGIISQLPGFDFRYWSDGKTTNDFLKEASSEELLGDLALKPLPEQEFNRHALAELCKRRLIELGETTDPTWPYSLQFALWSIDHHPSNASELLRFGTELIRSYVLALRDWPNPEMADGMTRPPMKNQVVPSGTSVEQEELELIDLGLTLIKNICENFDHLPPEERPRFIRQ